MRIVAQVFVLVLGQVCIHVGAEFVELDINSSLSPESLYALSDMLQNYQTVIHIKFSFTFKVNIGPYRITG